MKISIRKNMRFGASFGLTLICTYEAIIITAQCILAAFNGIPWIEIIEGIQTSVFYFSGFLLLPFTIISAFASILFVGTLLGYSRIKENSYIKTCVFYCLVISAMIYTASENLIYNIDEEATKHLNLIFRTIPSILFVIWGYFLSRYIYRSSKVSSNEQSPAS
ncbi:hypothetical protein ANAEL_05969 [Anaerolineales bacterium]|nr:hypothetical protein ANAEL_05969 [Anaerolineales bacterium]